VNKNATRIDAATLATKITELRDSHGWSKKELANRAGTSVSTIQKTENERSVPSNKILGKLAKALGDGNAELLKELIEIADVQREQEDHSHEPSQSIGSRSSGKEVAFVKGFPTKNKCTASPALYQKNEGEHYLSELKILPIDTLTKRFMASWLLPHGKDSIKEAARADYEIYCIRLIASKLVFDCTVVQFANFFVFSSGDPDVRDHVTSEISGNYVLRNQLAVKVAQSPGMDVIYWADKFFSWFSLEAKGFIRGITSKVEMTLLTASTKPEFAENYRYFGLSEYCHIIGSFALRDCTRAVRLYTHLCFKDGDKILTHASLDELHDLIILLRTYDVLPFIKECNCDKQVMDVVTKYSKITPEDARTDYGRLKSLRKI
jgi:transcriptional regulator with XRE-family HTH domain